MARIAENLLLLLLDNPDAQPVLARAPLGRTLAAALLLDLALDCRVRPAVTTDPVPAGSLVALAGPVPVDPAVRPAMAMLEQGPITPASAIARLRKRAEDDVLDQLLRSGQLHQVQLTSNRLRRNTYAWPMHRRDRVDAARAAVLAALFEGQRPDVVTAAIIALLTTTGGLGAALRLDGAALQQATQRAQQITFGAWGDGSATAEVNLAKTAASVLPALA